MSSIVRASTIGSEPVTLVDMKNFLKQPPNVSADDALITSLITAARQQAEVITECALIESTWVQYMDNFPLWRVRERGYNLGQAGHSSEHGHRHHGQIKLRRPPLRSVQSLVYIGADGNESTLNPGQDFVVDCAQQPGRIRPIPYTVWPLTLYTPNAVAISFTAGYRPTGSSPSTVSQDLTPSWQPNIATPQYNYLIDPNGNVEVQINSGSPSTGSAPNPPAWPAVGSTVTDGGCLWQNYGPLRGFWTPDTPYAGNWVILDKNSNLQLLLVPTLISQTSPPAGIAGAVTPSWQTTLGAITVDNGEQAWRCLGPYRALGNQSLSAPQAPAQQAAYTVDWALPSTVKIAIQQLVSHWYFNREPVVAGNAGTVPLHVESLLSSVTIRDYAPTPDGSDC